MRFAVPVIISLVVLLFPALSGAGVDNSLYANILEKYVSDGRVDYDDLTAHRGRLDGYLDMMGAVEPEGLSRNEQLAFYINLYNAATLQLIVDNYPVESIKDIGSFFSSPWKLKVVKLSGEMVTLDHIEHDIVRPRFKDNRVHFVLNCSAISCPPLLPAPFEAETVDAQLEQATIAFINDGENNYLDGKTLYVSKLFSWYSEDFPDDFVGWFTGYARGELKNGLEALDRNGKKPRIRHLKYDWDLNGQKH